MRLGWWRPIVAWKQFHSWTMIAHLICPPGNDRWKYLLKWYITTPWASFVAFSHRCRWGSHSFRPINLCGWKLGIRHRWMLSYFFSSMFVVVCQAEPFHADCDARAIVWSILPCLARHGLDARSIEVCLGFHLGVFTHSTCDYRHTIAQVCQS